MASVLRVKSAAQVFRTIIQQMPGAVRRHQIGDLTLLQLVKNAEDFAREASPTEDLAKQHEAAFVAVVGHVLDELTKTRDELEKIQHDKTLQLLFPDGERQTMKANLLLLREQFSKVMQEDDHNFSDALNQFYNNFLRVGSRLVQIQMDFSSSREEKAAELRKSVAEEIEATLKSPAFQAKMSDALRDKKTAGKITTPEAEMAFKDGFKEAARELLRQAHEKKLEALMQDEEQFTRAYLAVQKYRGPVREPLDEEQRLQSRLSRLDPEELQDMKKILALVEQHKYADAVPYVAKLPLKIRLALGEYYGPIDVEYLKAAMLNPDFRRARKEGSASVLPHSSTIAGLKGLPPMALTQAIEKDLNKAGAKKIALWVDVMDNVRQLLYKNGDKEDFRLMQFIFVAFKNAMASGKESAMLPAGSDVEKKFRRCERDMSRSRILVATPSTGELFQHDRVLREKQRQPSLSMEEVKEVKEDRRLQRK